MARTATIPQPEIVKEFPKPGREATYPWEEWTDGQIRKLIRGVHFKGTVRSMRQTCSKHAQANNLRVRTRSAKQGANELLFVQFLKK